MSNIKQINPGLIRQKTGDPLLGALGTALGTAAGAAVGGPAGAAIGGSLGGQLGGTGTIDPAQLAMAAAPLAGNAMGDMFSKTATDTATKLGTDPLAQAVPKELTKNDVVQGAMSQANQGMTASPLSSPTPPAAQPPGGINMEMLKKMGLGQVLTGGFGGVLTQNLFK